MTSTKRLAWIDWAKALLIWLMVWGHAGLKGYAHAYVYAFHMPAFFIISGYLYKPHKWQATIKSFLIPVLAFSSIYLFYYLIKMALKGEYISIYSIAMMITPPLYKIDNGEYITLFTGLWFIEVLIFCRFLLGDIKLFSFIRTHYKVMLPALIIIATLEPLYREYMHPLDSWDIYRVIYCMPYMMVGIMLKEHSSKLLNIRKCILAIMAMIYVVMTYFNTYVDISGNKLGINYIYTFINAIITSLLFFNILTELKASDIIVVFSVGTLLILGLHSIILQCCDSIIRHYSFHNITLLKSFIVMALCYFPIKWSMKSVPILLGKAK